MDSITTELEGLCEMTRVGTLPPTILQKAVDYSIHLKVPKLENSLKSVNMEEELSIRASLALAEQTGFLEPKIFEFTLGQLRSRKMLVRLAEGFNITAKDFPFYRVEIRTAPELCGGSLVDEEENKNKSSRASSKTKNKPMSPLEEEEEDVDPEARAPIPDNLFFDFRLLKQDLSGNREEKARYFLTADEYRLMRTTPLAKLSFEDKRLKRGDSVSAMKAGADQHLEIEDNAHLPRSCLVLEAAPLLNLVSRQYWQDPQMGG